MSNIQKRWVAVDLMGSLLDNGNIQFETEAEANQWAATQYPWALGIDFEELDVNMDLLTEVGEQWIEKIKKLATEGHNGRQIMNFHFSFGPEYLLKNRDERAQFVYEMLTTDFGTPVKSVDKDWNGVDDTEAMMDKVDLSKPWDLVDGKIVNV